MKLGTIEAKQPSQIRETQAGTFVCMGQSGAGKTTLLETLNDTAYDHVHVFDVDHKAHVLTDRPSRGIFPCDTYDELDKLVQEELKQRFSPDRPKVICFDGTTAIQQVLSYNKHKIRENANPQIRQTNYGNANLDLVNLAQSARLLAESGIFVIFNIWSMREKEESTDLVRVTPDLTPTMLTRMLGLLDFVVYLEPASMPKPPYPPVMYWGGNALRATRTAASPESPLSHMPDKIENPSWAEIFDSFSGKPFRPKP